VMDEPTNDLDADTLDLLEELVAQYAGTLLLVSHDRAFLDNVVTSTLVFEGNGRVNEYVGGYADWLRQSGAPLRSAREAGAGAAASSALQTPNEPSKPKPGRRLSYGEKRELARLPGTIQRLEQEQTQLHGKVNDPDFFKQQPDEAALALKRLTELAAELEAAYSRWESLESLGP
jgi:ABC transport system ATP-binding/permease protein